MSSPAPHFLLFSESRSPRTCTLPREGVMARGRWRFVLESVDGGSKLEVTDEEEGSDAERLELLAVVRGLEALNQPSRVTLVTRSRAISRGLRFGLAHWRDNHWRWESFGRMTPVKDADLWQRVNQALQFHDVQCRVWRFDAQEETRPRHAPAPSSHMRAALRQHSEAAAAGVDPAARGRWRWLPVTVPSLLRRRA